MSIAIYFTVLDQPLAEEHFNALIKPLSFDLKESILRFTRWQDRHVSLFGKLLLIKALSDHGELYTLTDLKYSTTGKPYLPPPINFNISHSDKIVICAFNNKDIRLGIDIEYIKPININDFEECFSSDELDHINSDLTPQKMFYQYWTIKEAVLKADGCGITDLKKLKVYNINYVMLNEYKWFVHHVTVHKDYICHLATETASNLVCIKECKI